MLRLRSLHSVISLQRSRAGASIKSSSINATTVRYFVAPTLVRCSGDDATNLKHKEAAAEIHTRRVAYKKQVSVLRKEYASEVALQRASDQAQQAAIDKELSRRRLERRRVQQIKAAKSSVKQLEVRRRRELEFEVELEGAQIHRNARKERFHKARQLVVDELEVEAPLWLTNHDEVEKAFTKATEQELWAFPNSIIGAPAPTDDAKFWNYESHTWHMEKTYQTQQEALLVEITELAYDNTNFDKSYWTAEKVEARKALEEKAKLRAMVKDAGRRSLLFKQKELLMDRFPQQQQQGRRNDGQIQIPRPMPVPNVKLLAHDDAMEKEGAEVLFKDPTQFFEFQKKMDASTDDEGNNSEYDGPTLGVPVRLRNDIKVEKTLDKAYPAVLGKMPKPDSRSAKEKKRDERERTMMAAAKSKEDLDMELGGDDMDGIDVDEIDFDTLKEQDDDAAWEEGLDPEVDKALLSLPSRERYTEDDMDAVIKRLEKKVTHLEEELDYELDLARQQLEAGMDSPQDMKFSEAAGADLMKDKFTVESGNEVYDIESLGVNPEDVTKILSSLTDEQMVALHTIDREIDASLGVDELRQKLVEVPGLTAEQIDSILQLEETLASSKMLADGKVGESTMDVKMEDIEAMLDAEAAAEKEEDDKKD